MLVSLITIVKHEVAHLRHLIRGVDAQSRPVDELVIVALGRVGVQAEAELASSPVTILHDPPAGYRPGATAAARAEGASIAVGDLLVFLDADLVPARDLVARYEEAALARQELLIGPVVEYGAEAPLATCGDRPDALARALADGPGNVAALREVWERTRPALEGRSGDDPTATGGSLRLVEDAVAYRQRRRCGVTRPWWEPVPVRSAERSADALQWRVG